jgi:hypothetical protein
LKLPPASAPTSTEGASGRKGERASSSVATPEGKPATGIARSPARPRPPAQPSQQAPQQ